MVSGCFGNKLEPDYAKRIDEFHTAYLSLTRGSITPKVCAVFFHVKEFIDKQKKKH